VRRVRAVELRVDEPFADEPRADDPLPTLVLLVVARFFAGARPEDEERVPEEPRPDPPWREDPARPLGRGLRLVAVTVPERYRAPPPAPGSPDPARGPVAPQRGPRSGRPLSV
jgi:hypothetical protein